MFSISFWFNLNILCTNQSGAMHRPTHYLFKMNTIQTFGFISTDDAMWCDVRCDVCCRKLEIKAGDCVVVVLAVNVDERNEMIESWFHTFTNHIFYYNAALLVHTSHHQTKRKFVSFSLQTLLCHSGLSWIITCLVDVTKSFSITCFSSECFSFKVALVCSFFLTGFCWIQEILYH